MASSASAEIRTIFKTLQRTCRNVFKGDNHALEVSRNRIKEEFRKHGHINDPNEIAKLLKIAKESEEMLRNKVIQAEKVAQDTFRLNGEHLRAKCVNVRDRCENCTCGM